MQSAFVILTREFPNSLQCLWNLKLNLCAAVSGELRTLQGFCCCAALWFPARCWCWSFPFWPAQLQRSFPSQHLHITFQSTAIKRTPKSVCSSSQSTFEDKFTVLEKKSPLKYKISRLINGPCLLFLFYPSLPPPFIRGPNWCKWTSEGVITPSIEET